MSRFSDEEDDGYVRVDTHLTFRETSSTKFDWATQPISWRLVLVILCSVIANIFIQNYMIETLIDPGVTMQIQPDPARFSTIEFKGSFLMRTNPSEGSDAVQLCLFDQKPNLVASDLKHKTYNVTIKKNLYFHEKQYLNAGSNVTLQWSFEDCEPFTVHLLVIPRDTQFRRFANLPNDMNHKSKSDH